MWETYWLALGIVIIAVLAAMLIFGLIVVFFGADENADYAPIYGDEPVHEEPKITYEEFEKVFYGKDRA